MWHVCVYVCVSEDIKPKEAGTLGANFLERKGSGKEMRSEVNLTFGNILLFPSRHFLFLKDAKKLIKKLQLVLQSTGMKFKFRTL